MAINRPDAAELLAVLRTFLEREVAPQVAGSTQFHLRVAGNVLGIVAREIAQRPAADAAEAAGLARLLGHGGPIEGLNSELVSKIRAGAFDGAEARRALLDHLKLVTAAKLSIDNPRYAEER
jgi:hypothetical protein